MYPTLSSLPKCMITQALVGVAYGYIFNVNMKVAALAFAIRTCAITVLFAIANPLFGGDLRIRSLRINNATHSLVATLAIVIFWRMQLIAVKGVIALAALECIFLYDRLMSIKEAENIKRFNG